MQNEPTTSEAARSSSRLKIILAVIGVVGGLSTALLNNWDKIFTRNEHGQNASSALIPADRTQITTGQQSPIVNATGDVSISYGIPASFLEAWAATLRAHGESESEIKATLKRVGDNFQTLLSELKQRALNHDGDAARLIPFVEQRDFQRAEEMLTHSKSPNPRAQDSPSYKFAQRTERTDSSQTTYTVGTIASGLTVSCSGRAEQRYIGTRYSFDEERMEEKTQSEFGSSIYPLANVDGFELLPPMDFHKGDCLRIAVEAVEGEVKNVVVRLLPKGIDIDEPRYILGALVGKTERDPIDQHLIRWPSIVGGVLSVPPGGIFDVQVDANLIGVELITLNSGTRVWSIELGPNNGTAKIVSIQYFKAR